MRINEAMNLIVHIFDKVEQYEQEKKLANYLTNIIVVDGLNRSKRSSDKPNPTSYEDSGLASNISDSELIENINQLHYNIQVNLILKQYYRAVGALKQIVFPFAEDYLQSNVVGDISDISLLANSLIKRINEFNSSVINENDHFIRNTKFGDEIGEIAPFYIWRNAEVHDDIQRLFDGKKIYLYADVFQGANRNAVKFSRIKLDFISKNQTINNQLHEILNKFHVKMTHMGESNYRCDNDVYVINSHSLDLSFSFAEYENGMPKETDQAYNKLASSVSSLSPYTLWSIELSHGDISRLESFANHVDIVLHGLGQYVEENAEICRTNLARYYSLKN